MARHSIPQHALRHRATDQRFANSDFGPEGVDGARDDVPPSNGWFDSSFDLRRGLEVIEWVLPDIGPGKPPPQ